MTQNMAGMARASVKDAVDEELAAGVDRTVLAFELIGEALALLAPGGRDIHRDHALVRAFLESASRRAGPPPASGPRRALS